MLRIKLKGFILAEVLITLGIIGIIAAMTLPVITQEYRQKVLETGLAKFYTTINQAFKASELENGEQRYWEFSDNSCAFYKKYLNKYLKTIRYECGYYNKVGDQGYSKMNDERFVGIYLPSGDMAVFSYGRVFIYIVKAQKHYGAYTALMSGGPTDKKQLYGTELFVFEMRATGIDDDNKFKYDTKTGVEPFNGLKKYSNQEILNQCINNRTSCAELIRRNGWKIPKNYPFQIK